MLEAETCALKPLLMTTALGLAALATVAAAATPSPAILVEYRDKPPYSHTVNGQPRGFLIERTVEVFRRAHIVASYVEMPVKRIVGDIQANQQRVCSPSWYKLPERELFARFSLPIHQDKPHVVLASAQSALAVRQHKTLQSLLNDQSLSLGVLDGVSYGPELDRMIARMPKPPMRAVMAVAQLSKMVALRRADYMLVDQEDLSFLDGRSDGAVLGLTVVEFADMPPGLKRYLMCSKNISDAELGAINQAIRQLVPALVP